MVTCLLLVLGFFSTIPIHYGFHRFVGHGPPTSRGFKSHAQGHHKSYTASDYLSESYRNDNGEVTLKHIFFLVPFIAGLFFLSIEVGTVLLGLLVGLGASVVLHEQWHIQGSVLERFSWFMEGRERHRLHHKWPKRNYGILIFYLDRFAGTYV